MKKSILFVILLIFVISGSYVFASESVLYKTVEETRLPKTYFNQSVELFSERKPLEQVLTEGWEKLEQQIDIYEYGISVDEIGDIYHGILFENPRLYYVTTGAGYAYYSDGTVAYVVPYYSENDPDVIAKTLSDIDAATEEIMLYIDESMTDFEKVMAVHDYMVLHYKYDNSYANYDITIMTTKTGVCMSYAFAFKHLMDELGIECLYVSSEEINHGWNLVKLEDKWYHIDLTWDDPGDRFGVVSHKYALLSDYEIQNLDKPHYGYNLNGLLADSDKYDKDKWHEDEGSIVTIDKIYYYVDGYNLVNQNGKVIFENLFGANGKWDIGGGYVFTDCKSYAGLAEYNGILYFNTDDTVYSYNPENEEIKKILEYEGICGLFVDGNTLEYCKYDRGKGYFVEAGTYKLGKTRFGGTFHKNGKINKMIYKDKDAEDVYVFADCGGCKQLKKITKEGVTKISFDEKEVQTLFYWNENMKPLSKKEVYK